MHFSYVRKTTVILKDIIWLRYVLLLLQLYVVISGFFRTLRDLWRQKSVMKSKMMTHYMEIYRDAPFPCSFTALLQLSLHYLLHCCVILDVFLFPLIIYSSVEFLVFANALSASTSSTTAPTLFQFLSFFFYWINLALVSLPQTCVVSFVIV